MNWIHSPEPSWTLKGKTQIWVVYSTDDGYFKVTDNQSDTPVILTNPSFETLKEAKNFAETLENSLDLYFCYESRSR